MRDHTDQALFADLITEYNQPFRGWDFSHLAGRMASIHTTSTWDYNARVTEAMSHAHSLLDMHTGGGELLAKLLTYQPVPKVYATETYAPNIIVAQQRLTPLGVTVYAADDDHLPIADNELALVINRHGSYDVDEVQRILKPGHLFITQQVSDQTNHVLRELLGSQRPLEHPWNREYAVQELEHAGWQVIEQKEGVSFTRFYDVGAIVYYLKAIPWEVPDFSVEKYWEQLVAIHQRIQREGYLDSPLHTFFLVAQKP